MYPLGEMRGGGRNGRRWDGAEREVLWCCSTCTQKKQPETDRLEAGKHRQADRQTGIDIKQTTELHNTPFAVQLLVRLMTGTGTSAERHAYQDSL